MKMLVEILKALGKRPETISYPIKTSLAPESYRGKHRIYPEKCIGCGLCVRVCPTFSIKLKRRESEIRVGKLIHKRVTHRIDSINLSTCVFCGLCAEVCPVKAIELTRNYELACDKFENLKVKK